MLRLLVDGAVAFVILGLTEAFLKPLAIAFVERPFRRVLPTVFSQIDREVPELLVKQADPEVVTAVIGSAIARATGQEATAKQIDKVVALYSPIKAALRGVIAED